ncbi:MAG: cyclic nucleotide-binding protein [Alphaproteobacteria bacterium HGW-Alphaproteobacteria-13]|jgi:CRP-like cAMP-binding protein|nr:MAG: cyclic nucleotide-binding protein [Alphaproteobacteria bacterium HGW-Alphaproteobacteria-13]
MPFREILNRLLTPGERVSWEACLARSGRDFPKAADIVREGEKPQALYVVLAGWAQKYKQLPDGRRQIVGLFLPGQICGLDLFTVARCDHSLAAVRQLSVAEIPRAEVCDLLQRCPSLARIFCWSELVETAVHREWMASVGQRNALERVAHLMCEMAVRQGGHRTNNRCDFLLTQGQIAEATGLTPVHVNRTIRELRRCCGMELRQRRLHIPRFDALASIACFDARYLHIGEAGTVADHARPLFDAWSSDGVPSPILHHT